MAKTKPTGLTAAIITLAQHVGEHNQLLKQALNLSDPTPQKKIDDLSDALVAVAETVGNNSQLLKQLLTTQPTASSPPSSSVWHGKLSTAGYRRSENGSHSIALQTPRPFISKPAVFVCRALGIYQFHPKTPERIQFDAWNDQVNMAELDLTLINVEVPDGQITADYQDAQGQLVSWNFYATGDVVS